MQFSLNCGPASSAQDATHQEFEILHFSCGIVHIFAP